MKKTIIVITVVALSVGAFAQAPDLFNYQGVARDIAGAALQSQAIGLRITILETTATGNIVYRETFQPTTNQFGLFTVQVGSGFVVAGDITTIDWGNDLHFMEIEMDATGGTNYQPMGTQQLISVPYAIHASTVENDSVNDADADPTNEYNTGVVLNGSNLETTDGGGTIITDLSSLADDDVDSTNEYNATVVLNGTDLETTDGGGTIITDLSSLADNDGDSTNELQDLSMSGDTLFISGGDSVVMPAQHWGATGNDISNTNSGNVGVGTTTPTEKLDVAGNVRIQGGTPAVGDVLTATNTNGTATWSAPPTVYTSYIRWGRSVCPVGTSVIYTGFAAGSSYNQTGSGANTLCLTQNPTYNFFNDGNQEGGLVYGVEFETNAYGVSALTGNDQYNGNCVACLVAGSSTTLMIPGTINCPAGWTGQYDGYLMSSHYTQEKSEFVCVDSAPELFGSNTNQNGNLWYPVEGELGSLTTPYVQNREISCVVCTR